MKEKPTSPITFSFAEMDAPTREAFSRYCDVELARCRAETAQTDNEFRERTEQRLAQERAAEPQRLIEMAKAQAEVQLIADASRLAQAQTDLEIRKLHTLGDAHEADAMVDVAAKAAAVFWPMLQSIGAGISAEAKADRELIREEMRLLAGRNPIDGTTN